MTSLRFLPYEAIIDGRRLRVRVAHDDEPGNWTLERDGEAIPIDEPADLLLAAAPGASATADFAIFSLRIRRSTEGKLLYRAAAQGVEGPERPGDEAALWALLRLLGDAQAPHACFFCRWSDIEPSTGWGNLGCFVANAAAYDAYIEAHRDSRLKWVTSAVPCVWVDEWGACPEFVVRPVGHGYRGRVG